MKIPALKCPKLSQNVPLFVFLLLLPGCGPYAQLQSDLVTQSREGLQRVEEARKRESASVTAYLADRRKRLDQAFDTDVLNQTDLTPAWVIDARKAYAQGLTHLAAAQSEHEKADAIAADNAAATDEALALLQRMLETQSRLTLFPKETP